MRFYFTLFVDIAYIYLYKIFLESDQIRMSSCLLTQIGHLKDYLVCGLGSGIWCIFQVATLMECSSAA